MHWDPCKGVSHRLEICVAKGRRLLQDQVQLGIRAKVQVQLQVYFEISQGSGKILFTCNRLIIDQWILENDNLKFTWWSF